MKIKRRTFIDKCTGERLDFFWKVRSSFPVFVNLEPMPNKALHSDGNSANCWVCWLERKNGII